MPDTQWGDDLTSKLALIARTQGRSENDVVRDAVRSYVEQHDEVFLAEARRQSLNAVARGWTEEDQYWESRAAFDEPEPPAGANGVE